MQCPKCHQPVDDNAVFCGNCGTQIAPIYAQGATVVSDAGTARPDDGRGPTVQSYGPPNPMVQEPPSAWSYGPGPAQQRIQSPPPITPIEPRPPSRPGGGGSRRFIFLASILVLLVIVVAAGVVALMTRNGPTTGNKNATPTVGQSSGATGAGTGASGIVQFSDSPNSQGQTNALTITVNGMSAPPSGFQYDAWLQNTQSEQSALALGTLTAQGQTFTVNFTNGNTNLVGAGDKVFITQEQGTASVPTGKTVLSGVLPKFALIHIRHLLFSFPNTPGHIGLLVGLLEQSQALNGQALLLKNAFASRNEVAIQCAAQSIVNILEGARGPHFHQLSAVCATVNITDPSDGYGLRGSNNYVATGKAHAQFAAEAPDATPNIKLHAGHVGIALTNIDGWGATVDHDVEGVLANPGQVNQNTINEIVSLSNRILNGIDLNGDEKVDPVPGEAGALVAYQHGQFMAILPLKPGS